MQKGLALFLRLLSAVGKWGVEVSIIVFATKHYYGLVSNPWYFYALLVVLMICFLKLETIFNDTAKKDTLTEEN